MVIVRAGLTVGDEAGIVITTVEAWGAIVIIAGVAGFSRIGQGAAHAFHTAINADGIVYAASLGGQAEAVACARQPRPTVGAIASVAAFAQACEWSAGAANAGEGATLTIAGAGGRGRLDALTRKA